MNGVSHLWNRFLRWSLKCRVYVLQPNAGDLLVLSCTADLETGERECLLEALNQICEQHNCRGILIGPGFNMDQGRPA